MFKKLIELYKALTKWFEKSIPTRRLDNDPIGSPRPWFCKDVEYSKKFTLEDLQTFTDRADLNTQFLERYRDQDVKSRKGTSALQLEIGTLSTMNNAFLQRHKGRMHYYRDDLSQKGKRVGPTSGQAMNYFLAFKKNLDN